jgi:acetyl esterase/lipase
MRLRNPRPSILLLIPLACAASQASLEEGAFDVRRGVVYARPDGVELHADVYLPTTSGPRPAVLVVHGGSWTRGGRGRMESVAERLALAGYVAVNIDYRLAPAHHFPAQVHDCKEAVRWIRSHAEELSVDPARVGGFGYSAGAHLVALLATTQPADGLEGPSFGPPVSTALQAAVLGAAPSDLHRLPPSPAVRGFLGGTEEEVPWLYDLASPIRYVSPGDPPVFVYHGRSDLVVPVSHARSMVEALERAGVPHEYHESDLGHVAAFFLDGDEVEKAIAFLDRHL